MKVSVVVTFYNSYQYVEKCINSILKQTYHDFEIIMIDDGSTDNTSEECNRFVCDYCKYVRQENSGVSVARNKGIEMATGEYVMFVDGDDFLPVDSIENLSADLLGDEDIVFGNYTEYNGTVYEDKCFFSNVSDFQKNKKKYLYLQLMNPKFEQSYDEIHAAVGVPWAKLYRLEFLKSNELKFDAMLRRMQDNVFNMYAFSQAKKIKYINNHVYNYRLEHITGYVKPYNADNLLLVSQKRKEFFYQNELKNDKDICIGYENERTHFLIHILKNVILSRSYCVAKEQMKKYINEFDDTITKKSTWKNSSSDYIFYLCIKIRSLFLLYNIYKIYVFVGRLKRKWKK